MATMNEHVFEELVLIISFALVLNDLICFSTWQHFQIKVVEQEGP